MTSGLAFLSVNNLFFSGQPLQSLTLACNRWAKGFMCQKSLQKKNKQRDDHDEIAQLKPALSYPFLVHVENHERICLSLGHLMETGYLTCQLKTF